MMGEFLEFFKTKKNLASLLTIGIVILALPLVIKLAKERQIIKSRAQGEPIDFTGGANVEKRGSEWVVLDPRNQITFSLTSPLGPAGPGPTNTPVPTVTGNATPVPTSTPILTPTPSPTPAVRVDRININLNAGWNLISFPRPLVNNTLNTFAGTTKLYYFNTNSQAWDWAIWRDGRWNGNLNSLEAGKAYWVEAPAAMTIPVEVATGDLGKPINKPPQPVPDGWNMVGYSTQGNVDSPVQVYLTSIGIENWTRLYRYNSQSQQYELAVNGQDLGNGFTKFEIGRGYWVCKGANCGVVPKQGE